MQKKHGNSLYWTTAVLCGLIMITALFFGGTLITSYTAIITADLGISRTSFSMYNVIRSLVTFAANLFMVRLVKWLSLKKLLLIGLISSALNLLILSFCNSFPAICALAMMGGVAAALCGVVPLTMVVRNWFQKSYGTILSVVMSSSGICGVLFSPAISLLTEATSWRVSFRVLAAVSFLIFTLSLFLLHPEPGELGMAAYGASPDNAPSHTEVAETPARQTVSLFGRDQASRDTRTLLFITACFSLGTLSIFSNVASVIQDIGISPLFATGVAISCSSFSNSAGKIGMGWVNDHFGTGIMLVLWYGLCPISTAYFLLFRAASEALAIPGILLIGFTAGIYTVPIPLACTKLFQDKDVCLRAMSLCSAGASLFCAFSNPICHGFYDCTGSYAGALLFSTVLGCTSFVMLLVLLQRNYQAFFPGSRPTRIACGHGMRRK